MTDVLKASLVNSYLAHKQHLLPASRLANVVQVTRDIVALHATAATGPYLSLWARVPDFQRQGLEDALYKRREMVRVHCMRKTVHAVPSEKVRQNKQEIIPRFPTRKRRQIDIGACQPDDKRGKRVRPLFFDSSRNSAKRLTAQRITRDHFNTIGKYTDRFPSSNRANSLR